jgi:hypothetical protein
VKLEDKKRIVAIFITSFFLFGVNIHSISFTTPGPLRPIPMVISSPEEMHKVELQQKIPLLISSHGGSSNTFSQSDFTYLGFFKVPSGHMPNTGGGENQVIGFNEVGGVVHEMLVQDYAHGDFSNTGYGALYEFTDPGSGYTNNLSTAPRGTFVKNWGRTNGDTSSFYDMWGGKLGTSLCYSNSVWADTVTHGSPCTPGSTVLIGDAGSGQGNFIVEGLHYYDDGSHTCCWYITGGQGYSNYSPDSTILLSNLISNGNVQTNGPFRACVGTFGADGTGGDTCGGLRAMYLFDSPDNTMGFGGGVAAWQQNTSAKGPQAFWGGVSWPNMSTTSGYGSTRGGDVSKRTTDLVPTTKALWFGTLDNNINCDGTIISGPNITFRRYTDPTFGNYTYENAGLCAAEEIDPLKYGGVGSWTGVDYLNDAVYADTFPKSGVFYGATLVVGHTWYKTQAGFTYQEEGTGPTLIFQRNIDEALGCSVYSDYNANILVQVKPAFYTNVVANAVTLELRNPGTPNASPSVTHSGNNVVVHLATDGSSQVTTTANSIITLISGDSFSNSALSITIPAYPNCLIPFGSSSTGNGIATTITDTRLNNGGPASSMLSSGVMTPASGPQWCPLHNISSPFTVTGPTSSSASEPAIIIYSTSKIQAAPTSGNHDYSLDPESVVFLHNIDPTISFGRGANDGPSISGMYFQTSTNRLFVGAPYRDPDSYPGCCSVMPITHVFQLNNSIPIPSEILGSLLLMYTLSLVSIGKIRSGEKDELA